MTDRQRIGWKPGRNALERADHEVERGARALVQSLPSADFNSQEFTALRLLAQRQPAAQDYMVTVDGLQYDVVRVHAPSCATNGQGGQPCDCHPSAYAAPMGEPAQLPHIGPQTGIKATGKMPNLPKP